MVGPVKGPRLDVGMLRESRVYQHEKSRLLRLRCLITICNSPFRGAVLLAHQMRFNELNVSVESMRRREIQQNFNLVS